MDRKRFSKRNLIILLASYFLIPSPLVLQAESVLSPPLLAISVSSPFGFRHHPTLKELRFHEGIDLRASSGAPVYATQKGLVVFSGKHFSYGKLIVVKHKGDYTSHYAHLEDIFVRAGEYVLANSKLGTVGETGVTTGPHLHFELRQNGTPLNPLLYLEASG